MNDEQISLSEAQNRVSEKSQTRVGPKAVTIPVEWEVTQLNQIASVSGGKRLPKGHSYSSEKTDYPYIRVVDFENESISTDDLKYIDEETRKQIERYTISDEDVYISIAGTLGVAGTIPESLSGANLTENAAKIQELNGIQRDYLSYYIHSKFGQDEVHRFTVGSTQPKLSLFRLRKLEVIRPPLPEQRKIATVLYTVDRAIEKTDDVINRLSRVQKSTLRNLFRNGVGEPSETKTTPMGQFPKDWELKTMERVGSLINGNAFPKEYQGNSEGKYPFVKVSDTNDYRRYVSGAKNYISQDVAEKIGCNIHPEGTVILPKRGVAIMTNKRRILAQDSAIDNNQIGIVGENVKPLFLYYYLSGVDMGRFVQEGAVKSLTKSLLSKIRVPVPPLETQSKIVAILESIDEQIEAEKRIKTQQECLKRGLMQDLLSGTVRTTDTNMEVPDEITQHG